MSLEKTGSWKISTVGNWQLYFLNSKTSSFMRHYAMGQKTSHKMYNFIIQLNLEFKNMPKNNAPKS